MNELHTLNEMESVSGGMPIGGAAALVGGMAYSVALMGAFGGPVGMAIGGVIGAGIGIWAASRA
jgi:hypothetical protein